MRLERPEPTGVPPPRAGRIAWYDLGSAGGLWAPSSRRQPRWLVDVWPWTKNGGVVRLREYYQDPNAPRAHDVLVAAFAAVRNAAGEVLVVRRIDDGNWELPGGRIEVGESAVQAVIREVVEESGVTIALTGLSGVYSDPTHVLLDPDGTVHQQLALCFHAVPATAHDAEESRSEGIETNAAAWYGPAALSNMVMHPAMRLRLHDAIVAPHRTHFE